MRELTKISQLAEEHDGTQTLILCRNNTYLSGTPHLFSAFIGRAFIFKNAEQAKQLIRKFPVILAGGRVGQLNPKRYRIESAESA